MMHYADALLDLLGDLLLKGQQPEAKSDLVAHLGVGVVFEDVNEAVRRDKVGQARFEVELLTLP